MQPIRQNRNGFTIIEVIIVIVLIGIFSYGIAIYVSHVAESWKFLTQRYDLEQNGKLAADFLTRDLREIDIDSSGNPDMSLASSSGITFLDSEGETTVYNYSGDTIYKNSQPLVKDATGFEIKYYDQNNAEISPANGGLTSAQIEQVWYLYIRFILTKGDQRVTLSSYIFPRNFLAR